MISKYSSELSTGDNPSGRFIVTVPDTWLRDHLDPLPSNCEVLLWDLAGEPPVSRADLVVLPYLSTLDPVRALAAIEVPVVQSPALGFNGIEELLGPGIRFANGTSVHETATAEHALALTLAMQRELPDLFSAQQVAEWPVSVGFRPGLADSRVTVIGYGGVGKKVVQLLEPFEVQLTVVATRARTEGDLAVHGQAELAAILAETDIAIVTVPLTDSTRHLIGEQFLQALPSGALVVNVSRGAVADTDAVLRHASEGRVRFALDVTDPEPLPGDHTLWRAPGVLITPHAAAATRAMGPRWLRLVRTQIERLSRGEDPVNIVIET